MHAPRRGVASSPRLELPGATPPMAPSEGPANNPKNQERRRRRRCSSRHPRTRACLLKGCPRRFRPEHALERYCSPECRQEAVFGASCFAGPWKKKSDKAHHPFHWRNSKLGYYCHRLSKNVIGVDTRWGDRLRLLQKSKWPLRRVAIAKINDVSQTGVKPTACQKH